ncbi:MAG: hypothetical protein RLZ64_1737, partial [Pseudomonadota bacterium]
MSFPDYDRPRRRFLIGGLGVAGALVVGWTLLPPRQRLHASPPVSWLEQGYALNGWISVSTDNRITVMLTKSEMGQGVMTSLAMLVAEELDVPLTSVSMKQAPLRSIYGDTSMAADGLPFHPDDQGLVKRGAQWMSRKLMRELGLMVTGGSSSVKDSWLPMREAGAAARARLVAAAARAWGVPEAECSTAQGQVSHSSGRSASYGELAPSAAAIGDVPFTLKSSQDFKLIGTDATRLDVPAKVDGSAQFGLDIRLEGLRYAMLAMCPVFGGTLKSIDASAVEKLPGVVRVMSLQADSSGAQDAVAVIAESRWQAMQAVEQLKPVWDEGMNAHLSSESIAHALLEAVDNENAFSYHQRGDMKNVVSAKRITADFSAPLLAHAAMEPVNATAQFANGRLKLWVPTQTPSLAVKVAARVAERGGARGRVLERLAAGPQAIGTAAYSELLAQAGRALAEDPLTLATPRQRAELLGRLRAADPRIAAAAQRALAGLFARLRALGDWTRMESLAAALQREGLRHEPQLWAWRMVAALEGSAQNTPAETLAQAWLACEPRSVSAAQAAAAAACVRGEWTLARQRLAPAVAATPAERLELALARVALAAPGEERRARALELRRCVWSLRAQGLAAGWELLLDGDTGLIGMLSRAREREGWMRSDQLEWLSALARELGAVFPRTLPGFAGAESVPLEPGELVHLERMLEQQQLELQRENARLLDATLREL